MTANLSTGAPSPTAAGAGAGCGVGFGIYGISAPFDIQTDTGMTVVTVTTTPATWLGAAREKSNAAI